MCLFGVETQGKRTGYPLSSPPPFHSFSTSSSPSRVDSPQVPSSAGAGRPYHSGGQQAEQVEHLQTGSSLGVHHPFLLSGLAGAAGCAFSASSPKSNHGSG